jgi:hypothetical protein
MNPDFLAIRRAHDLAACQHRPLVGGGLVMVENPARFPALQVKHNEAWDTGVSDVSKLPVKAYVVDVALGARHRVERVDPADAIRLWSDDDDLHAARYHTAAKTGGTGVDDPELLVRAYP